MDAHPLVAAAREVGVSDELVLDAVGTVPRASFVPPELTALADAARQLPIPHDQVATQPSLVARMVEAVALTGSERLLKVGTGYGCQTALLARLGAQVRSVERWDDLAGAARTHLARHRATGVVGRHGFAQ